MVDPVVVTEPAAATTAPEPTPAVDPKFEPTAPPAAAGPAAAAPAPVTEPAVQAEPSAEPTADPTTVSDERVVPSVDKYVLPEGVPRHVAQAAFDNDMTQAQLDNSLKQFGGYINESKKGEQAQLRKLGEDHVKSWGDVSESNLTLVRRALRQNDPDGTFRKALDETGYGNHPAVLDLFLRIGKSMREGGFLKGSVNRPPGKKTAATAMFGDKHPSAESQ